MINFKSYIVTIVGMSLIISILEIVAPFGKMKDFCKSIFGVFYIYVLLLPVINFISQYV